MKIDDLNQLENILGLRTQRTSYYKYVKIILNFVNVLIRNIEIICIL